MYVSISISYIETTFPSFPFPPPGAWSVYNNKFPWLMENVGFVTAGRMFVCSCKKLAAIINNAKNTDFDMHMYYVTM